jgi:coenzyme PQQ synthesis protein D (PqqD)
VTDLDLTARVRIPSHVVYREFPAETVILNLETGQYHGLNRTGGAILASLERTPNLQDTVTAVAKEYGQSPTEVERDVRAFCGDLLERGLILLDSAGG